MTDSSTQELIAEMKSLLARLEQLSQERLEAVEEATRPPNFRGIKEETNYLYNK